MSLTYILMYVYNKTNQENKQTYFYSEVVRHKFRKKETNECLCRVTVIKYLRVVCSWLCFVFFWIDYKLVPCLTRCKYIQHQIFSHQRYDKKYSIYLKLLISLWCTSFFIETKEKEKFDRQARKDNSNSEP